MPARSGRLIFPIVVLLPDRGNPDSSGSIPSNQSVQIPGTSSSRNGFAVVAWGASRWLISVHPHVVIARLDRAPSIPELLRLNISALVDLRMRRDNGEAVARG
jgi:hypothetical protein